MNRDEGVTCPRCGRGELVDMAFDEPGRGEDAPSRQGGDSRQILTYSCGHRVVGASLAGADSEALDVERRASGETVDPSPSDTGDDAGTSS